MLPERPAPIFIDQAMAEVARRGRVNPVVNPFELAKVLFLGKALTMAGVEAVRRYRPPNVDRAATTAVTRSSAPPSAEQ